MKKIPIAALELKYIDYRNLLPLQGSVRWLPTAGYDRLKNSFESEGLVLPFFVWKKGSSFFLLDGHGREKLFTKENATFLNSIGEETYEVPCVVIEAENEAEAKKRILLVNSQYQQWTNNKEEIFEFLRNVDFDWLNTTTNIPAFNLPDVKIADLFLPEEPEDEEFESESIYEYKPNPLFGRGMNAYDIPVLFPDKICEIPSPIETWTGDNKDGNYLFLQGHNTKNVVTEKSVLCFYANDDHFDGIWTKLLQWTEKIKASNYLCVISPNYSITTEEPLAFQVWQIYRTRYITRYWQEAGIKVIPDVIWSDKKSFDFAFLGIPKNCACVSLQMQNCHDIAAWELGFKEMLKVVEPQSIFAYAPPEKRYLLERNLPDSFKITYAMPWINLRRQKINKEL